MTSPRNICIVVGSIMTCIPKEDCQLLVSNQEDRRNQPVVNGPNNKHVLVIDLLSCLIAPVFKVSLKEDIAQRRLTNRLVCVEVDSNTLW